MVPKKKKKIVMVPREKNKKQGLSLKAKKRIDFLSFFLFDQVVRGVAMGTSRGLGLNVRFLFNYCLFSILSLLFCFSLQVFFFGQDLTKYPFCSTVLEVPFFSQKPKKVFALKKVNHCFSISLIVSLHLCLDEVIEVKALKS